MQQTVTASERNFANFARSFQVTVENWEVDREAFCNARHDLEEDRIESKKDIVWACANVVSAACVSDEEVCASRETKVLLLTFSH